MPTQQSLERSFEMIKLVIFDLDGVLVDARELHYQALNEALSDIDPKYTIHRAEHLSTYDGLSTTKKLKMLTDDKGLPEDTREKKACRFECVQI